MKHLRLSQTAVLLALVHALPISAQVHEDVRLVIRTSNAQSTFQIGEVIPIQMEFTGPTDRPYSLSIPKWDRSGRVEIDAFQVKPSTGWSDPLAFHFRSMWWRMGGGPVAFQNLSDAPTVVPINLNEWVRFDQPGKYAVAIESGRVSSLSSGASEALKVKSNTLHLTIVPAKQEWQKKTILEATGTLDSTQLSGTSYPDQRRGEAINALRYLGTTDAALALIRYVDVMDLNHAAYFGLVSSPAMQAALDEMKLLLADPDWPVTPDFLAAMVELALPRDAGSDQVRRERQNLEEQFISDLRHFVTLKRGNALKVSQGTILMKTQKHP